MILSIEYSLNHNEALPLLDASPRATFFHAPVWLEVLTRSFPAFRGGWITAREGDELVGFMPFVEIRKGPLKSIWAMPFGTYGDPIVRDKATAPELIDRFFEISSGLGYTRAGADLLFTDVSGDMGGAVIRGTSECRIIELEGDFDSYKARIVSKKRRQLHNKAQREGVVVEKIESLEDLRSLYGIYEEGSSGWGGVHPYPLRLFEELFASRDKGAVFWGAYHDGAFLGGHIDLYFGRVAQAWQAGMTEKASEYDISAMLVFSAVEEAYRRGMREFNLGSSGRHEGIRFFKESLGGKEHLYSSLSMEKRLFRLFRRR